jgi:hypothetical protein
VQYQNSGQDFLSCDDERHRFAFANMAVFRHLSGETGASGVLTGALAEDEEVK